METPVLKSLLLVGAGNWGKNHARNFYQLGALHSLCDSNETILENYKAIYPDVRLTMGYKKALEDPQIDKVVIASPAASHFSLAKQALEAGKDVLVEKPLCLKFGEAEELIALAQRKSLILMVGHLLQYHPAIKSLQELVGRGELGKLQYISSNRLNLGSIRTEENALWSFAPHDISVILSLCGHVLPEQLRCIGGAYLSHQIADTTMMTMRFANDLRAHIYVSWLHPFKEQKLVVVGTSGLAVFDDIQPWDRKLVVYRNPVTWKDGSTPQANKSLPEAIDVIPGEPLLDECRHFLRCCQNRTAPRTDGIEGLRVLKVLQAAQESLMEDGESRVFEKESASKHVRADYFAHPTAVIANGAVIGEGSKIWHFSHIMAGAKIGTNCNIGQNVVVSPQVILGRNVKVQNNVSIYSGVICEDDVFIGPSVVFTNVINPRSAVDRRGQFQSTLVKLGTTIGANATIVCGVELGEYSFIGAGAVITKNIKSFALVVGNPARQIGWMSRHGVRLDLPLASENENEIKAACSLTGEEYCLKGNVVQLGEAL